MRLPAIPHTDPRHRADWAAFFGLSASSFPPIVTDSLPRAAPNGSKVDMAAPCRPLALVDSPREPPSATASGG